VGLAQSDKSEAERKKERDATLGVLNYENKYDSYGPLRYALFALVDLSLRDEKTNTPFLYLLMVDGTGENCPLKIGRTYKAHMVNGNVTSILINGMPVAIKIWKTIGMQCNSRLSPEGGHWEATANGGYTCKSGAKETVNWKADKGSKQEIARSNSKIPPCDLLQPPFHDTVLTVVTTVKPAANYEWTMDDEPAFFAGALLDYLNQHTTKNIRFKEANGVTPNLYFQVTMFQSNEGTQQNRASVEVTGLGKEGVLFTATSGQSPFTNMRDAFNRTGQKMLTWFEGGWHRPGPCRAPNGDVLP